MWLYHHGANKLFLLEIFSWDDISIRTWVKDKANYTVALKIKLLQSRMCVGRVGYTPTLRSLLFDTGVYYLLCDYDKWQVFPKNIIYIGRTKVIKHWFDISSYCLRIIST